MSETPPEQPEYTGDWITRASMRAMRLAYADAILENLRFGLPVIQWREDKGVLKVPAEMLAPLARRIIEVNGEALDPEEEEKLYRAREAFVESLPNVAPEPSYPPR